MLTAKKSVWFEKLFAIYNRNLFKRRFNSLKVSGLDLLLAKEKQTPLIIYANHSSWWDGLVAFEISRAARLDAFLMMEEKQLKKLFPFRYLGAFSVIRDNPREAAKSIIYARKLLKEKTDKTLWIFPQGLILPNDARPIRFYNGISRIIEKLNTCFVVPAAFRYEFLGEFKPEIFVKLGMPEKIKADGNFNSKLITKVFEQKLELVLDDLKNDVLKAEFADYKSII